MKTTPTTSKGKASASRTKTQATPETKPAKSTAMPKENKARITLESRPLTTDEALSKFIHESGLDKAYFEFMLQKVKGQSKIIGLMRATKDPVLENLANTQDKAIRVLEYPLEIIIKAAADAEKRAGKLQSAA